MESRANVYRLTEPSDWDGFRKDHGLPARGQNHDANFALLQDGGAEMCLVETVYFDQDFTELYTRFYAKLYRPYHKYCKRLHFFSEFDQELAQKLNDGDAARSLAVMAEKYLGYIVLRPVDHAPISSAVLSKSLLSEAEGFLVSVYATYEVHVLGVTFKVEGFPFTQQDQRVGACAQAAIWMCARHFYKKRNGLWVSLAGITELALGSEQAQMTDALPAGSESLNLGLTQRAFSKLGRQPVILLKPKEKPWRMIESVYRHLDSGIPVLLAFKDAEMGEHAHVVACCGMKLRSDASVPAYGAVTHLIIHDDQAGSYISVPVEELLDSIKTERKYGSLKKGAILDAWIVPYPRNVFIKAEDAETAARITLSASMKKARDENPDKIPEIFSDADYESRIYLTFGHKLRSRLISGGGIDAFLVDFLYRNALPKLVWVTEFRAKEYNGSEVDAIVASDATGSELWKGAIFTYGKNMISTLTYSRENRDRMIANDLFHETTAKFPAKKRGEY